MNRRARTAFGAAMVLFTAAGTWVFAQGASMLESQIAQSQARVERLRNDMIEMDGRIENNVNQLITLLAGVRDSTETGTHIVRAKEDILGRLKNSIDDYQRQRNIIVGGPNSPWQQTPTAGQQQTLDILDERTEQRVEQIVELASSLATHEDFEKYTIERRTQIRNYKQTVSEEYRSNQRVTARSEPARERVVEAGEASIADLERRTADLERQLRTARSPAQREGLERQLDEANERLYTRRSQVDTMASTYPPDTRPVGEDEASEILEFVDDEVRQIQEDFRRLQLIKSDFDHEHNRLRSLQVRAGAANRP